MSGLGKPALPLDAVRTDEGGVVVPESRRADGSVRKAIRIRPGYVPQDEVPKYKPIGQRLREQEAKTRNGDAVATDAGSVTEALDKLSLSAKPQPAESAAARPATSERPRQQRKTPHKHSPPSSTSDAAAPSLKELKTELSAVNKSLREIAKLEHFQAAYERQEDGSRPLTDFQQRKLHRKAALESRRQEIIAVLDSSVDTSQPVRRRPEPADDKPKTLRVIEL